MQIDVAFTPAEARNWRGGGVAIVVDVLRASSCVVTMLERGAEGVIPVASMRTARRMARAGGLLLAGERGGLKPPGFDFGNSPAEFAAVDLTGRRAVLTTSNGTRALAEVAASPAVLIGCLLNATACCRQGLALAVEHGAGLGIVCAGSGGRFALDDAVCVGFLVDTAARLACASGSFLTLTDGAHAAHRLWKSYQEFETPFRESWSGKRVIEIGSEVDLGLCARVDVSTLVPILVQGDPPVLQPLA